MDEAGEVPIDVDEVIKPDTSEKKDNGETPTVEEVEKYFVTQHIMGKLSSALARGKIDQSGNPMQDLTAALMEIWPENNGERAEQKPVFKIPGSREGVSVRFEHNSNEYDRARKTITLGIDRLSRAKTPEEVKLALIALTEAAHHESEHIYVPGSTLEPETPQETIQYLSNPGEISAHGRQFAFRYMTEFPGEEFDIAKMTDFATRQMQEKAGNKAYNYFVAFADPSKQTQYEQYGDLAAIHVQILEATKRHMKSLKQLANIGARERT